MTNLDLLLDFDDSIIRNFNILGINSIEELADAITSPKKVHNRSLSFSVNITLEYYGHNAADIMKCIEELLYQK